MRYRENPKTKGSGIVCAIPQRERCPINCDDCFFQSGRSYLEPLAENLPNLPPVEETEGRVVRVNDGNDSNNQREQVLEATKAYRWKFYNTSLPDDLAGFGAPVVLTVNPGAMTDIAFHEFEPIPPNLMFVRIRTNTWNLEMVDVAVDYYAAHEVVVVLTFMAYYTGQIPAAHQESYMLRRRTLNEYQAITTAAWEEVMRRYQNSPWVYSCGKVEGELGTTGCRFCGNCLREFFAALERMSDR